MTTLRKKIKFEYIIIGLLIIFYVIPNFNKVKQLNFTDLFVLEMFYFLFQRIYNTIRKE